MTDMSCNANASDEAPYNKAVLDMENGDVFAKTKVAFYKLTGGGGAEVDVKEAVAMLEECAEEGESEAMWMLGLCSLNLHSFLRIEK